MEPQETSPKSTSAQGGSAPGGNPIIWVMFAIVVLAVAGGIWYAVAQGNRNTNTTNSTNTINATAGNANATNNSQVIAGANQRYDGAGISVTIPNGWFLSTENVNPESPFVLSTTRGATSILGLPDRQGVVALVIKRDPIQEDSLETYLRAQEADFRRRMPDSPSKIEHVTLNGREFWKWTTDTLETFQGEGSYGESYFIPLPNALVDFAVTTYGKDAINSHQADITTIVLSVR